MKILVTGGTGVVGNGAIPELLRAGHAVRLLSRHADHDTPAFPEGVEAFPADVNDPTTLAGAVEGCDVVLHIAGVVEEQPPEITFERVNVEGTRNMLEAAADAGHPRFIYLSSLGADVGKSEYHRSKRAAEALVQLNAGPWLILRPGNVYGPGDETISMLLKMLRSLPAVPIVGEGDQPFQPLWYVDLARAILRAVERTELNQEILELAGPDVTTTNDIFSRLARITGRNPPRLSIPAWVTEVGARAAEVLGGFGQKLLQQARLPMPVNTAKLSMLLEGNVIDDASENALMTRLNVKPTSLQVGLERLVDLLPEQTPGSGFGAVEWTRYYADIEGTSLSPEQLLDRVCENITEIMPLEFAAEPGVPHTANQGSTLTAAIPGRGHIQVRVEDRTPTQVTFVTLEGHPLAGILRFETSTVDQRLRFAVNIAAQSANALDWVAMRTFGAAAQTANWRDVVRRVIQLAGGTAPRGVQRESAMLNDEEARRLAASTERLVQEQHRRQMETQARDDAQTTARQ
jgi:uncharacterized protein YbjT (DUF2867 family)